MFNCELLFQTDGSRKDKSTCLLSIKQTSSQNETSSRHDLA